MKTHAQRVQQRKWYARLWWVSFHVYDYVALVYAGVLTPSAQGTSDFATYVAIASLNFAMYIRLQTSSPGFVGATADLEKGKVNDGDGPVADAAGESDGDRLVTQSEPGATRNEQGLRHCNECQILQPLRTKHCKDCNRCVRQYDHHCDCAGTCIGETNRRYFVFYLLMQSIEAFQILGLSATAFTLQSSVDEWLVVNMPYIVVWISVLFTFLIAFPLFCYQAFLISTNQTSWEHARRSSITYLQRLPDEKSPFDRGFLRNWWTFITDGNGNLWVHPTAPHQDETSIM